MDFFSDLCPRLFDAFFGDSIGEKKSGRLKFDEPAADHDRRLFHKERFLFAKHRYAGHNAAADAEQRDPPSRIADASGLGWSGGLRRAMIREAIGLSMIGLRFSVIRW